MPPAPEVDGQDDWFYRAPFDERKAQIRVLPISSNGEMRVTFTKAVDWLPEMLAKIEVENLV